jgi:hypothetical protein
MTETRDAESARWLNPTVPAALVVGARRIPTDPRPLGAAAGFECSGTAA